MAETNWSKVVGVRMCRVAVTWLHPTTTVVIVVSTGPRHKRWTYHHILRLTLYLQEDTRLAVVFGSGGRDVDGKDLRKA